MNLRRKCMVFHCQSGYLLSSQWRFLEYFIHYHFPWCRQLIDIGTRKNSTERICILMHFPFFAHQLVFQATQLCSNETFSVITHDESVCYGTGLQGVAYGQSQRVHATGKILVNIHESKHNCKASPVKLTKTSLTIFEGS